jgi:nucleotide-binding universal stress UspA family protein
MVSKILAPLDGTEIAEAGLLWAGHAAQRTGASVHLLTVVEQDQPEMEAKVRKAEAYLQSRRDHLKKSGVAVKMEVTTGEPAAKILRRAEDVDVTVVTSGTVRWLISAVLDRVLEKMTRPLVVVRASQGQAAAAPGMDKILVAVDQASYSSDIVPVVQGFAKAFGASITLCHAVAPLVDEYGQPAQASTAGASVALHEANFFVERVAQQLQDEGIETDSVVAVGDPPGQIVRTAQRCGAGLIALTTRGRDHLDSRLVGSTANAVLHSTRLPCLLTRAVATDGRFAGPRSSGTVRS